MFTRPVSCLSHSGIAFTSPDFKFFFLQRKDEDVSRQLRNTLVTTRLQMANSD